MPTSFAVIWSPFWKDWNLLRMPLSSENPLTLFFIVHRLVSLYNTLILLYTMVIQALKLSVQNRPKTIFSELLRDHKEADGLTNNRQKIRPRKVFESMGIYRGYALDFRQCIHLQSEKLSPLQVLAEAVREVSTWDWSCDETNGLLLWWTTPFHTSFVALLRNWKSQLHYSTWPGILSLWGSVHSIRPIWHIWRRGWEVHLLSKMLQRVAGGRTKS